MRSFLASSAQLNVNRKQSGRNRSYVSHKNSSRKRSGLNFHHDSIISSGQRSSISAMRHKSAYDRDSMRMKSDANFRRGSSVSMLFNSLDEGVVAELELLRSVGDSQADERATTVAPNTRCSNGLYQRLDRNPFTKRRKDERIRKQSIKRRKNTLRNLTKVHPDQEKGEKKKNEDDATNPIRILFGMFKQNENGEVNMGDMLEFLELHEVLIPSDLRVIATLSKNLRKKQLRDKDASSVSSISSSMGSEETLAKTRRDAEIVSITYKQFKKLAEELELVPTQLAEENEGQQKDLKYLTAGIGDGKFTDEIDESVRKSPSMVARELHLQGNDAPWYIMYPDHTSRLCWDLLILLLLLYTVTITPVRLGFEMQPVTWSTYLTHLRLLRVRVSRISLNIYMYKFSNTQIHRYRVLDGNIHRFVFHCGCVLKLHHIVRTGRWSHDCGGSQDCVTLHANLVCL